MRETADGDSAKPAPGKSPGRPRDPAVHGAILRATTSRLASDGYSRMTIGDIAADAGVTRPTVYRRWASKYELVVDALDFNFREQRELNPVGPLEKLPPVEMLKTALRHATPFGTTTGRGVLVIGNVLSEAERNPALLELVRVHGIAPRVQLLNDTLLHLHKQGALRPDLDLEVISDMVIGSYYSSFIRTGGHDPELPERTVAALWPLISRQPAVARPGPDPHPGD
jgi:AcrR family transcriptional regulator